MPLSPERKSSASRGAAGLAPFVDALFEAPEAVGGPREAGGAEAAHDVADAPGERAQLARRGRCFPPPGVEAAAGAPPGAGGAGQRAQPGVGGGTPVVESGCGDVHDAPVFVRRLPPILVGVRFVRARAVVSACERPPVPRAVRFVPAAAPVSVRERRSPSIKIPLVRPTRT